MVARPPSHDGESILHSRRRGAAGKRGLEPMPDLPADRCVIFEQSRRTDDTTPLNDKGNKVFEKLTDERRKPSAEKGDQYK
jgi:hypothetical protein